MNHTTRLVRLIRLFPVVCLLVASAHRCLVQAQQPPAKATPHAKAAKPDARSTAELAAERKRLERREFQAQELMLARSGSWIFKPGETPQVLWRDVETVRRLGCTQLLRVRWFGAKFREAPAPDTPGRWVAWIEGTAPNGTPLRRSLTFYGLPQQQMPLSYFPDLTVAFPNFPGPRAPAVVKEHQTEITRLAGDMVVKAVLDSENGAILLAGLAEAKPLGRPARYVESASAMNDDYQLALKLKVQGLQDKVRPLRPPRRRAKPATVLHEGTPAEAGVAPDAKARIDALCQAWADDTSEPFVTLVARRGVIVTHEAFGRDPSGKPIDRDYRCWVASITKTVTGILFSQFLDQGLAGLDDSLATVFPDYADSASHVPTFRQCFNHTTGLAGIGQFGGMRNPQLENVVLNGIDVNAPGVTYAYCGLGYELAVKAMEILAGQSAVRLYDEHLFRPLGFGDVTIGSASDDGHFTAMELGILAQWVANRGSYGPLEFIRPATFVRLLPEPLRVAEHGAWDSDGIDIHHMRHYKASAPRGSHRDEDLLFSPNTIGHGSFSSCVFLIDPDAQLVITQVRQHSGPRHDEWSPKFFQTIASVLREFPSGREARSTPAVMGHRP